MQNQIELKSMSEHDFKEYLTFITKDFAQDVANNFNKSFEVAYEESKQMMERLLPDGLNTEEQYLYDILDTNSNQKVGILWFNIRSESNEAFIYHIFIDEAYRGNGYGKQSLEHMETVVKELGVKSIGLNVFGHNESAFNLYKKLGYNVSAISMDKAL